MRYKLDVAMEREPLLFLSPALTGPSFFAYSRRAEVVEYSVS